MKHEIDLIGWLNEATTATRYSIEANFRTSLDEVAEGFAKISLGYVSAALKQDGYHVKLVLEEKPLRIMVASRNWSDGEWVAVASFNPDHGKGTFVLTKGFYIKERNTVSKVSSHEVSGRTPADLTKDLRNMMHQLKGQPDRHQEKLKSIKLKRGPKS